MFNCGREEYSDTPTGNLADEAGVGQTRSLLAVGLDLDDVEEVIFDIPILVCI